MTNVMINASMLSLRPIVVTKARTYRPRHTIECFESCAFVLFCDSKKLAVLMNAFIFRNLNLKLLSGAILVV